MLFDENGDREQMRFWIEAVGKEKLEEGIRIGEERMLKKQTDMIRAMLREGTDDSYILKVTGVTPQYLASLKVQFAKKKKIAERSAWQGVFTVRNARRTRFVHL